MKFYPVSKLQAAERQIETAAKLYFSDDDSIAVHTLVEAGHTILKDLAVHCDMTLPQEGIWNLIKPERRDEFKRKVREPRNFFNHANRDPEGTLNFNPDTNELMLLYAILAYMKFSDNQPFYMSAFKFYYMIHYPDAFLNTDEGFREFAIDAREMSKREFIEAMRSVDFNQL